MKMVTKSFKGSAVFLSRNLVAPEVFDAVHDALKLNGAEVNLCCDPSRTGPNDHHVISDPQHEKFKDLKAKGCNLLGPECVLSCAKEKRNLPKQRGFTCCLAMDGVKILASGFEKDEKVEIEELVTAMGGVIQNRASNDVSFVVVKNVLAAKYKWALTVLKKPIVTTSWLKQCWKEHRVVPQEQHRVLPFSGLRICVTRVKADIRKEMEKLVLQNGGEYSADLTRSCTHLISDAPEGDKYKVARRWGQHIVTPKWLDQSIARRACLDEESYPVQISSTFSAGIMKGGTIGGLMEQHSQPKDSACSQSIQSSMIEELETTLSQNMSSAFSDGTIFTKDGDSETPNLQAGDETNFEGFVADDSESEDDDSYLSDCRILFVGFQASELRKLVKLVQKGGGSRCMSFSEQKMTHIVVGTPSENEKKEIRHHAALGVIYVVKTVWLEDCDQIKKEVPVSQRHICDSLLPKAFTGNSGINQGKSSTEGSVLPTFQVKKDMTFEAGVSLENGKERKSTKNPEGGNFSEQTSKSGRQDQFYSLDDGCRDQKKVHPYSGSQDKRLSSIFKGLLFRFSSSFPEDRRAEVVEWVNQGEGMIVDDHSKQNVQFTIESHGLIRTFANISQTTIVSSHWIKFCLEGGCMPDVGSHIIFSPLRCRIPFPGFEGFRFCVSQYDKEDKLLLRNLCVVLGAKFSEKLNKRVTTHLLCKFSSGLKYESACKWGIQSVTSDWISECIRKDTIIPMDSFRPRDATAQDREATTSQYPTQAARMASGDVPSQFPSQSQVTETISSIAINSNSSKRVMLTEGDSHTYLPPAKLYKETPTGKFDFLRNSNSDDIPEVSRDADCKWGIHPVSAVSECTRQDTGVPTDHFVPKDVRTQVVDAGLCTLGQSSTEAAGVKSGDVSSQSNHYSVPENSSYIGNNNSSKRVRLTEDNNHKEIPVGSIAESGKISHAVLDVAAAIEDLLAESNKIQDTATQGRNESDQTIFSPECSILGQDHVDSRPIFGISKHWLSRNDKVDLCNSSGREANPVPYDGFSETQTESQVVVYEEDLSGRQRIIERVQTRSSLS